MIVTQQLTATLEVLCVAARCGLFSKDVDKQGHGEDEPVTVGATCTLAALLHKS